MTEQPSWPPKLGSHRQDRGWVSDRDAYRRLGDDLRRVGDIGGTALAPNHESRWLRRYRLWMGVLGAPAYPLVHAALDARCVSSAAARRDQNEGGMMTVKYGAEHLKPEDMPTEQEQEHIRGLTEALCEIFESAREACGEKVLWSAWTSALLSDMGTGMLNDRENAAKIHEAYIDRAKTTLEAVQFQTIELLDKITTHGLGKGTTN